MGDDVQGYSANLGDPASVFEGSAPGLDGLIGLELLGMEEFPGSDNVQIDRHAGDIRSIIRDRLAPQMLDPAREQHKIDLLVKYAVDDCGVSAPSQFLRLIGELDRVSSSDPKVRHLSILDRMYYLAQMNRAHRAIEEAYRVG